MAVQCFELSIDFFLWLTRTFVIGSQLPFSLNDLPHFFLLTLLSPILIWASLLLLKQAGSHVKVFAAAFTSAWNVFLPVDSIV
jgi:hypothetical protein